MVRLRILAIFIGILFAGCTLVPTGSDSFTTAEPAHGPSRNNVNTIFVNGTILVGAGGPEIAGHRVQSARGTGQTQDDIIIGSGVSRLSAWLNVSAPTQASDIGIVVSRPNGTLLRSDDSLSSSTGVHIVVEEPEPGRWGVGIDARRVDVQTQYVLELHVEAAHSS